VVDSSFERMLNLLKESSANYIGVRHAIGVGSGTDALVIALKALGVKRGDEIITVSFTFTSTVDSIVHNNGIPVLLI